MVFSIVIIHQFLGKKFRFKDKIIVKNISSAFTWAAPPAFIPLALKDEDFLVSVISFVTIFLIALALEIIWDVRDIKGDRKYGINTIPNTFGLRATKIVCSIFNSISGFLMLKYMYYYSSLSALLFSYIFIFTARPTRSTTFFHGLIIMWMVLIFIGIVFKI